MFCLKLVNSANNGSAYEKENQKDIMNGKQIISDQGLMTSILKDHQGLYNIKCWWMVSNGDSKAFTKVNENNVYGEDSKAEKVDCVGHVQKRMGKHLRTLRQNKKGILSERW